MPETTEFQLTFLTSLIPRSFDGKRSEFHEFITNCNNAVELANDSQQKALFVYIISKLTGSVRSQLQGKTYTDWQQLKDILYTFYQDRKHYITLMEELNTLKQGITEPIASFHEKIDKLTTRLFSAMTYKNKNEQLGKIETIKELALSRFIHHSKPDISRFLRGQDLTDLSEALSKALEEERAIGISNAEFRQKPSSSSKYCSFCRSQGHFTKDCFKKQRNTQNINFNNSQFKPKLHPSNEKICNYCKNKGHLINECRKREYNNKRKQQFQQSPNPVNRQNSESINLNCPTPPVNAALVECDIQMA